MGILFAILGAVLMALIFILFAVVLKMDEFITGIGLNLFSLGLTTYLLQQVFDVRGMFANPLIVPVPVVNIPWIKDIPIVGDILSGHNLIVYLTVIAVILVNYLVFKTRFGLRLRAAGYNRTCLDTSGVSANKVRIWSLILCAVLCGLAGAFLSLGIITGFTKGMSAGKGWISLAAVILVSGNPTGIALISLLFGFTDGLGLFMQQSLPSQFTSMVPYVATLVALFVYSIRLKKKLTV
jgi:simple sugar transport system permease protein